ncbi:conserved hypothetical protein [Vibrio chagasii]|nr:conserved hypothetical protein [Vibrio chagasii]
MPLIKSQFSCNVILGFTQEVAIINLTEATDSKLHLEPVKMDIESCLPTDWFEFLPLNRNSLEGSSAYLLKGEGLFDEDSVHYQNVSIKEVALSIS